MYIWVLLYRFTYGGTFIYGYSYKGVPNIGVPLFSCTLGVKTSEGFMSVMTGKSENLKLMLVLVLLGHELGHETLISPRRIPLDPLKLIVFDFLLESYFLFPNG